MLVAIVVPGLGFYYDPVFLRRGLLVRASKLCRVNFSINMTYTNFFLKFFDEIDPILTAANADTPASRINKKKSSPEKCIFFLPIRSYLTLIL